MKITGKIVKTPIVKEKVIFTAIKEAADQKPIQLVLFRTARPLALSTMLSNVKIDDEVTITGRLESNPKSSEIQIVIDDIDIKQEYKELPLPEYF
jgi:aspartyl/asparaginyl-tRNA synthetase